MNKYRFIKQVMLMIGLASMVLTLAYADRDDRERGERREHRNDRQVQKNYQGGNFERRNNRIPPKGYIKDKRFNHNQYYPRRGYNIFKLPPQHYEVHHGHDRYYYSGGIWYRPHGGRYIVIAPPIGVFVPVLPAFYTTLWFGGVPYYYANDVYYVWDAGRGGYVVTNPPPQINAQEQPPLDSDQLYIYPKQGQSEQQQANDRYACHEWGVKQTGYDPSEPPANMSQEELNNQRMEYRRAMMACLEGRGYTVR